MGFRASDFFCDQSMNRLCQLTDFGKRQHVVFTSRCRHLRLPSNLLGVNSLRSLPPLQPSYPTGTPLSARIRAPLIGKRRFYLAPTTTDIPLAFAKRDDIPTRISLELVLPDSEDGEPHPGIPTDHPSIAELVALRIGKRPRGLGNVQSDPPPRGDGPPILGRITSKFPFLGYPKPSDTNDPFPCLFQLTLSDSTYNGPHSIKVNVWNKNAVEMWWVLQIGDVVWVEDYKARSVRGGGVEVMVNPGRYGSFLRIVKRELSGRCGGCG